MMGILTSYTNVSVNQLMNVSITTKKHQKRQQSIMQSYFYKRTAQVRY